MRQLIIALNMIVTIFFVGFLTYTFVARQHLDGYARGFVTEKTIDYAKPIVEVADGVMQSPLVQQLLTDDQATAIRNEITQFQKNPAAYIADLTQLKKLPPAPPQLNPLLNKVSNFKARIREFYDNTLDALILDLRIFAFSNLCAAIIAFCLAYCSPQKIRQSIVWFSFLIFASVLYSSYLYVDGLTFFRILFRTHMGWSYPLLLAVVLVSLFLNYGRSGQPKEQALVADRLEKKVRTEEE